ncbi:MULTISPECIES: rhomboid family intramembrane serine protease [Sphingobacterium]|jgi:membrane associated rhomboid family serine protease|uniref:Rhomboid family protein n=1 Tax=Sphingobacterium siyangense TaxID=459529 RepID=A0A562M8X5_9SPHI|nr:MULTISPECIES: rhomboid family intramembrane serine protease [Sphingobacterium]APU95960.1 rhomboid family intramembrane serine protease [Sphingobacterium sp. B29]TWI16387.1 rhomboid family protein [Sphingobacterium siyangense]UQA76317.1 rhomboid family intramembrane serine protease [Sphingobacterium siyangense]
MKFFDIFPTFAESPYSYIVVPIILVCSIIGFYNKSFFHALILHPYEIARGKRIHTLLTSALIHRNWIHLLFNCIVIFGLGYDMCAVLNQAHGITIAYVFTIFIFLLLIILPNLIQTLFKKKDFTFTAVGSSGLSFGLFGFSGLFFPLQKMNHLFIPWIHNSTHYWIYALLTSVLLSLIKISKINRSLHLVAFVLGSILALIMSPYAIELKDAF